MRHKRTTNPAPGRGNQNKCLAACGAVLSRGVGVHLWRDVDCKGCLLRKKKGDRLLDEQCERRGISRTGDSVVDALACLIDLQSRRKR